MPGLNGAELIRRARKIKPRLPAILVTGYADALEDFDDAPVLRKPVAFAVLQYAIESLLGAAQQQR